MGVDSEKLENTPDEELVLLAVANEDYYLVLMQRYEERLLRYIGRLTHYGDDDARDVLQDAFIKAYQNIYSFDAKHKFSSWLYRIVHNESVSSMRKRSARPAVTHAIDDETIMNTLQSELRSDSDVEQQFVTQEIAKALSVLDVKYRDVLVLKYFEDKSYEEISEILHKPPNTVGTLLARARTKLKAQLVEQRPTNLHQQDEQENPTRS